MEKMTTLDLDSFQLSIGAHSSLEAGACVMELTAYMAGEQWSDHPACVSPVIGAFLRRWNDDLGYADRQRLKPYIARVIGTNTGTADDERRAWMLTDWMVRTYLPAWLRLAKLDTQAVAVERLPELTDADSWKKAKPTVTDAEEKSAAAWAAARAAAGDAAGDAAWAAAGDAAWAAARAAARDAAGEKLKPTVLSLQASAFDLLDRLIAVGKEAQP